MSDVYVEPLENPFARPAPAPAHTQEAPTRAAETARARAPEAAQPPAARRRQAAATHEAEPEEAPDVEAPPPPPRKGGGKPTVTGADTHVVEWQGTPGTQRKKGCLAACGRCCAGCHATVVSSKGLSSAVLIAFAVVSFGLFVYSCVLLKGKPRANGCWLGCGGGGNSTCAMMVPSGSCGDICNSDTLGPYTPFYFLASNSADSVYCTFPVFLSNIRIVVAFFSALFALYTVLAICRPHMRVSLLGTFVLLVASAVGYSYLMIMDASAVDKGHKACQGRFSAVRASVVRDVVLQCNPSMFAAVAVVEFALIPLAVYAAVLSCARYRQAANDRARESSRHLAVAGDRPDFDRPEGRPEAIERPNFEASSPQDAVKRPTFE